MRIHSVTFARPVSSWAALPDDGLPEVALVGRSNVGKSSLLNALVGRRQVARTSQTPGKTQALNFYVVESEPAKGAGGRVVAPGKTFYLVDLPGYGYAKVAQTQRAAWQRLAERYLDERYAAGRLRVVCALIDSRHEPQASDLELIDRLREAGVPFVVVLTKADKLSANQRASRVAGLKRRLLEDGLEPAIAVTSAEKKEGLEEVWGWVEVFVGGQ
jgi:GTP-binding protein